MPGRGPLSGLPLHHQSDAARRRPQGHAHPDFARSLRYQKREHAVEAHRGQRQAEHCEEPGKRRDEARAFAQPIHAHLHGIDRDRQRGIDCCHLLPQPRRDGALLQRRAQYRDGVTAERGSVRAEPVILRPCRHGKPRVLHVRGHAHHWRPTLVAVEVELLADRILRSEHAPRQRCAENDRSLRVRALTLVKSSAGDDGYAERSKISGRHVAECDVAAILRQRRVARHADVGKRPASHAAGGWNRIAQREVRAARILRQPLFQCGIKCIDLFC